LQGEETEWCPSHFSAGKEKGNGVFLPLANASDERPPPLPPTAFSSPFLSVDWSRSYRTVLPFPHRPLGSVSFFPKAEAHFLPLKDRTFSPLSRAKVVDDQFLSLFAKLSTFPSPLSIMIEGFSTIACSGVLFLKRLEGPIGRVFSLPPDRGKGEACLPPADELDILFPLLFWWKRGVLLYFSSREESPRSGGFSFFFLKRKEGLKPSALLSPSFP